MVISEDQMDANSPRCYAGELGERSERQVAYVVTQPTLISHWPELDDFVRSIGPFLACAWCALERSRTVSGPVAAEGLASAALDTLASLRVLQRIPIAAPNSGARSLYEPLAWTYQAAWSRQDVSLEARLTSTLTRWAAECPSTAKRTLGTSLAESEARAYLANLLRKYRLSPTLGNGLRSTQLPEWNALSLGRKRYVLWAGMRNVASEFLKAHLDEEAARRVLDREISRRCTWLVSRVQSGALGPTDFCFVPGHGWRQPLILDVAMETFIPLGRQYWLQPSSDWRL